MVISSIGSISTQDARRFVLYVLLRYNLNRDEHDPTD